MFPSNRTLFQHMIFLKQLTVPMCIELSLELLLTKKIVVRKNSFHSTFNSVGYAHIFTDFILGSW
jgi:hypothetical protein